MAESCGKDCYTNGKGCAVTSTGICVYRLSQVLSRHISTKTFYDPKKDLCRARNERIAKIVSERKPIRVPLKKCDTKAG